MAVSSAALHGPFPVGGAKAIEHVFALAWAGQCPLAHVGALEVREVAYSPL